MNEQFRNLIVVIGLVYILLTGCASHSIDSYPPTSIAVKQSQVPSTEEAAILASLPRVLDCIWKRNPEPCGIEDLHTSGMSDLELRASFGSGVVYISPGSDNEIDVVFERSSETSATGIVIYKREGLGVHPEFVSVIVP